MKHWAAFYPLDYSLSLHKNSFIQDTSGDHGGWNLFFRRNLSDEELEEGLNIMNLLNNIQLTQSRDYWAWKLTTKAILSIKSAG